MKVKQLIAWLKKQPQNASVAVYADHSQCTMMASTMTVLRYTKHAVQHSQILDDDSRLEAGGEGVVEIGSP